MTAITQRCDTGTRYVIVGGAGFIGSHFTDALLADPAVSAVTLYDNFSSGREWHYAHHRGDPRLHVIRGDVLNMERLTASLAGHDTVIHLASNPDIARAEAEPDIDFHQGTELTNNVVEAMRRAGVPRILYASGSGVYGDLGLVAAAEDHAPLRPVSTYGASKLAGEALIGAYCAMFGLSGRAFRFGNVVGPRQTHGVGLDFIKRLSAAPDHLRVLGDGTQSKSYIHVFDVVAAVLHAHRNCAAAFDIFNVATGDYITVTEIAGLAADCLELTAPPRLDYTGGPRGWRGDVPVVRLDTDRIRALGWANRWNTREALRQSLTALLDDVRAGRL